MKKLFVMLSSLLVLAACGTKEASTPTLTIEGGDIQGVTTELPGVVAYKGIPYAAPPLGDLRWRAPQPVIPWEGVRVCDRFGNPSYQSVHYPGGYTTEWGYGDEAPYSEDCLYLNVWTKASGQPDKKLPVALWIHGGGYREGWGSEPEFYAEEWAAKDVVLVSINYRLGVFGFLTHPDLMAESEHGVSGNYGILDQIQSLKWIQNNIAQFGGDPDNVMIFGQSAGGGSVRTLCESPLARGLFHKAVIMSAGGVNIPPKDKEGAEGVSATPRAAFFTFNPTLEQDAANNKKILDWAGLTDLEKMRRASTEVLHTVGTLYNQVNAERVMMMPRPIVDGYVSLKSFDDAARDGSLADVPYMIGYTLNDMGSMAAGIAEFCKVREAQGGKAWAYEFARPLPDDGKHPEVTNRLRGAFHSSDLWYVFKTLKYCWRPWTQGDWDLSEKMLTAWSNFAKYSDPNNQGESVWTPCTEADPSFMLFKLDEQDAESSEMGEPIVPEPTGFPMF